MSTSYKNFVEGIAITPKALTTSSLKGDLEVLSSTNKIYFHNGTINDPLVTETGTATLTNKTIDGATNTLTNISIATSISGLGTGVSTFLTTPSSANLITAVTDETGTGSLVFATSPTLVTPALGTPSSVDLANATNLPISTGVSGLAAGIATFLSTSSSANLAAAITDETGTGALVFATTPTLVTPILGAATASSITGIAGGDLVLNSPSGQNVVLQNNGTTTETITSTGVTLASGKTLVLTNNGQTVTLQGSPAATASYTITYPAATPGASTALVFDGTNYVWSTAGGWTITDSTSLAGGGTIAISLTAGQQAFRVASSGGAVTLSTTPFGATNPAQGAVIRLIGTDDTNTVEIVNSDTANGALVNGNAILAKGYVIDFMYSLTDDRYFETSRNF